MEAAEILGISRVAVFKRIKAGKIQARRVGRHYVIEKSQILYAVEKPAEELTLTKDFYSIPEVADILGKTRIAIFKQVQKGSIQARRIGRHYVIARQDVPGAVTLREEVSVGIENYISVSEAAKQLGISRIAVFKKIKKGQIQAVRMGRSYAIPKSEVQARLNE